MTNKTKKIVLLIERFFFYIVKNKFHKHRKLRILRISEIRQIIHSRNSARD